MIDMQCFQKKVNLGKNSNPSSSLWIQSKLSGYKNQKNLWSSSVVETLRPEREDQKSISNLSFV